jgi:hypothetical protein
MNEKSKVDLLPPFQKWGLEPRSQGNRGTCSVFTVIGALEFAIAQEQGRTVRLSVEFLNWAAHKAANRTADGGFFSEIWKGYEVYGICPEDALPYLPTYNPELQPTQEALHQAKKLRSLDLRLQWIKEWDVKTGLTGAQLIEVKRVLGSGMPVCGGFRWPHNPRWKQGTLQMCKPEEVFDGHSVLLVGYEDLNRLPGSSVFHILNSGGNRREGAMLYEYVRAYMNDACWIDFG